jgi:hypothetical protein
MNQLLIFMFYHHVVIFILRQTNPTICEELIQILELQAVVVLESDFRFFRLTVSYE